jgi:hypothetical protein
MVNPRNRDNFASRMCLELASLCNGQIRVSSGRQLCTKMDFERENYP